MDSGMNQGDVCWYTFRFPDKRRPVLVLTRTSATTFLTGITIAPITSTIRRTPSEAGPTIADGLFTQSAAHLATIPTVQKARHISTTSKPCRKHRSAHLLRTCHQQNCARYGARLSLPWDLTPLSNSETSRSTLTANKSLHAPLPTSAI